MELTWHGERFVALAERGLYWPRHKALMVADLHWGKDSTFRAHGIPVSNRHLADELKRLVTLCNAVDAQALWVLGDLIHARSGLDAPTLAQIDRVLPDLPSNRMLVEGNHDRGLLDHAQAWGFACVEEPFEVDGFELAHHPGVGARPRFCGHLHPTYQLKQGFERLRLPCFYATGDLFLLPAFTGFSNGPVQTPEPAQGVWVTTGKQVFKAR